MTCSQLPFPLNRAQALVLLQSHIVLQHDRPAAGFWVTIVPEMFSPLPSLYFFHAIAFVTLFLLCILFSSIRKLATVASKVTEAF